mmetsp:Transcript_17426/g.39769  ORF Transcript_17426/g.39769 Transcript_17426/m.39769 type:complete len:311 (+) Transcript_17426:1975-2907(+)
MVFLFSDHREPSPQNGTPTHSPDRGKGVVGKELDFQDANIVGRRFFFRLFWFLGWVFNEFVVLDGPPDVSLWSVFRYGMSGEQKGLVVKVGCRELFFEDFVVLLLPRVQSPEDLFQLEFSARSRIEHRCLEKGRVVLRVGKATHLYPSLRHRQVRVDHGGSADSAAAARAVLVGVVRRLVWLRLVGAVARTSSASTAQYGVVEEAFLRGGHDLPLKKGVRDILARRGRARGRLSVFVVGPVRGEDEPAPHQVPFPLELSELAIAIEDGAVVAILGVVTAEKPQLVRDFLFLVGILLKGPVFFQHQEDLLA